MNHGTIGSRPSVGYSDTGLGRIWCRRGVRREHVFACRQPFGLFRQSRDRHYGKLCRSGGVCPLLETGTFSSDESAGVYSCCCRVNHSAAFLPLFPVSRENTGEKVVHSVVQDGTNAQNYRRTPDKWMILRIQTPNSINSKHCQ